jgi:hypothetical protein
MTTMTMRTNERAALYQSVREMRDRREKLTAIAASLGLDDSQVCRYLQWGCWEKYPMQHDRYEMFEALIAEGMTQCEIAARCYITMSAVAGVLNRGRHPEYEKTRPRAPPPTREPTEPRKITLPALKFLTTVPEHT